MMSGGFEPRGTDDPEHGADDGELVGPGCAGGRRRAQVPGVYLAKQGPDGRLVYVGYGGERRGKGIRGRLDMYIRLGGLATGLGRAVTMRWQTSVGCVNGPHG